MRLSCNLMKVNGNVHATFLQDRLKDKTVIMKTLKLYNIVDSEQLNWNQKLSIKSIFIQIKL